MEKVAVSLLCTISTVVYIGRIFCFDYCVTLVSVSTIRVHTHFKISTWQLSCITNDGAEEATAFTWRNRKLLLDKILSVNNWKDTCTTHML